MWKLVSRCTEPLLFCVDQRHCEGVSGPVQRRSRLSPDCAHVNSKAHVSWVSEDQCTCTIIVYAYWASPSMLTGFGQLRAELACQASGLTCSLLTYDHHSCALSLPKPELSRVWAGQVQYAGVMVTRGPGKSARH